MRARPDHPPDGEDGTQARQEISGEAVVDQSCMIGESMGVAKRRGAPVFAGTVVSEGALVAEAFHVGGETRLASVVRRLKHAEQFKSELQTRAVVLADKVAPITVALAGLVFVLTRDVTKAVSVLVVDYSCAIKLATPLAVNAALLESAERGAMAKGGRFLEELARVDTVLLDKTGTVTRAEPSVIDVAAFAGHDQEFVLRNAACLEEHFPHPVARAVVQAAEARLLAHDEHHSEVEYVIAHGIVSRLNGERILVGSRHFAVDDEGIDVSAADDVVPQWSERGLSILYVCMGGQLIGLIGIEDPIEPTAPAFVASLRGEGIGRIAMLTGDNQRAGAKVAGELGIHEVHAGLLPDDKHELVERMKADGHRLLVLGDGINDTAAIGAAQGDGHAMECSFPLDCPPAVQHSALT